MNSTKNKIALAYWIGYVFFLCLYFYNENIDAYKNSEKGRGQVVDQLVGTSRGWKGGGTYNYPQLVFVYNDSQYFFADKSMYAKSLSRGDSATIIFPRKHPGEARVYSIISYWISFPVVMVSFMISLFIFMIPIFASQYSRFKKEYRQ